MRTQSTSQNSCALFVQISSGLNRKVPIRNAGAIILSSRDESRVDMGLDGAVDVAALDS